MATTGPTSLPSFFNTDTDFRNWVSGIITAITTVGLVQTADTGQINTSTVTKPAATNTSQGYAIFRFNDSLQSTAPVYLKVEFGSGNPATRPSIWITAANVTDGAGTLSNQISTRTQRSMQVTKSAGATLPLYASGTSSRLHMFVSYDSGTTNGSLCFFIERTKDSTGTETADGFFIMVYVTAFQLIPFTGLIPGQASSGGPCMPVSVGSSHTDGTNVAISHGVCFLGKPFYFLLLSGTAADLPSATNTFTATVLGSSHTWWVSNFTGGNFAYGAAGAEACCMLWE